MQKGCIFGFSRFLKKIFAQNTCLYTGNNSRPFPQLCACFLRRFWNFDARDFEQFPIKYWNLAFWLINNFLPDKHILISRYLYCPGVRTSRGLGPAGCGDRRGMAIFWGGVHCVRGEQSVWHLYLLLSYLLCHNHFSM